MPGDVNNDGLVDTLDYSLFRASYGKSTGDSGYNVGADFNNDGIVDGDDYSLLGSTDDDSDGDGYLDGEELNAGSDPFNQNSSPGASIPTVSEWGMIIFFMLLVGSALWVMRRRKGQEL